MPLMLEWREGGLSGVRQQRDACGMTRYVTRFGDVVLLPSLIVKYHYIE
jgi:hypothetical protein